MGRWQPGTTITGTPAAGGAGVGKSGGTLVADGAAAGTDGTAAGHHAVASSGKLRRASAVVGTRYGQLELNWGDRSGANSRAGPWRCAALAASAAALYTST